MIHPAPSNSVPGREPHHEADPVTWGVESSALRSSGSESGSRPSSSPLWLFAKEFDLASGLPLLPVLPGRRLGHFPRTVGQETSGRYSERAGARVDLTRTATRTSTSATPDRLTRPPKDAPSRSASGREAHDAEDQPPRPRGRPYRIAIRGLMPSIDMSPLTSSGRRGDRRIAGKSRACPETPVSAAARKAGPSPRPSIATSDSSRRRRGPPYDSA